MTVKGCFEIYNHQGKLLFLNKVGSVGTNFTMKIEYYRLKDKFLKKLTEEINEYKEKK